MKTDHALTSVASCGAGRGRAGRPPGLADLLTRALPALLAALAATGLAPEASAQGIAASRLPRPYVMIALDSSGSMEWEPGTTKIPTCGSGADGKSRWISAAEVLTGTMPGYSCSVEPRGVKGYEYQAGYYIPHIVPRYSKQPEDGLLDVYIDRINFGLSTFDSEPSPRTDLLGGWSYPEGDDMLARRHAYHSVAGVKVQAIDWTNADKTCTYRWNVGARRPDKNFPSQNEGIDGGMIALYTEPPGKALGWYRKLNRTIQDALLGDIKPYWNSPIGALLEDMSFYFDPAKGHDHVKAARHGGRDCYYECRDRHVILITDGVPSGEGMPSCDRSLPVGTAGACPYRTAEDAAYQLHLDDIQLHVVGFSLVNETIDYAADGTKAAAPRTGAQVVWDIGVASYGGSEDLCPWNFTKTARVCAYYAGTAEELRDALSDVFDRIMSDAATQTRTATLNTFVRSQKVMGQYQFFSSMNITAGGPWEGNIEQVRWVCDDSGGSWEVVPDATYSGDGIFDYGDEGLDTLAIPARNYGVRRLYTVPPDGNIPPHAGAARAFTKLDSGLAPEAFGLLAGETAARDDLLDWVHGADGTERCESRLAGECRRLGAIFHSTPVPVGPPSLELPLESYNIGPHKSGYDAPASANHVSYSGDRQIGFRQLYGKRPQILYAASTDGILHAFEVDRASGDPRELWGFVPPMLLDNLRLQMLGEMFLLDGNISVQDLRLWKDERGTSSTVDEWATVLVMGLRQGGGDRGFFALDVTAPIAEETYPRPVDAPAGGTMRLPADPGTLATLGSGSYGAPRLLWEIAPDRSTGTAYSGYGDNARGGKPSTFASLGLAYGRPAFGTVVLDRNPPDHPTTRGEVAIAILPAGLRPDPAADPAHVGCGLYIVRASDGQLIRWLYPTATSTGGGVRCQVVGGVPSCSYSGGYDCQFAGTPLAIGGLPGDVTTRIFAGDSQGHLYRADLRSSNPADWSLDLFFDFGNGQPIEAAPAAALDDRGLVTIIVGTGDPDDLESRTVNRMASITETFGFAASGALKPGTCSVRWSQVTGGFLDDGNRVCPAYCAGCTQGVYPYVNWVIEFANGWSAPRAGALGTPVVNGERLLGWPIIFDDVAYFTTFVPNRSTVECCWPGRGRVWGVHFTGDDPNVTNDVFRPATSADPNPGVEVQLLNENEVAFGLSLVRQPSCFEYQGEFSFEDTTHASFGAASEPRYSLVLHNNLPPGATLDGTITPETSFREIELEAPRPTCRPDTWSSIFAL